MKQLGLKTSLADVGLSVQAHEQMMASANLERLRNNPIVLSQQQMLQHFLSALDETTH